METDGGLADLLRRSAPQVLATLVRRHGDFDACEDAVQEALLAAALQWPVEGVPESPRGWLTTVAARRLTDQYRSEVARRRREATTAARLPADEQWVPGPDAERPEDQDDTLRLLFLCCHPSLSPPAQAALTLRAVGGLSTDQIAKAFLTSESTMAQRIRRAKQRIRASGIPFQLPPRQELPDRLRVVLHVLYLIFNEGYTATSGPQLQRGELTGEAIRLTREVHRLRPAAGEVAGLLALMLLTDARRAARTRADGTLIPLGEQDRSRWDQAAIREGISLLTSTLPTGPAGPYQLQAAIAAVHAEAARAEETDWPQILALYDLLQRVSPSPVVALNRIVAVAMVHGPQAALGLLGGLAADDRLAGHHRLEATRAHLLEMAGDHPAAQTCYRLAARRTASLLERRYLEDRAARLVGGEAR
ncbi:RNA polymerase sigma factor [Plantactinospora sp. WMMC1484]|uniref:RNA polymerase sigma factor n=1 Tax=Plantactinospora sp. WMMC1484 TaxID=3404122 RepID=UPI003BF4C5C3